MHISEFPNLPTPHRGGMRVDLAAVCRGEDTQIVGLPLAAGERVYVQASDGYSFEFIWDGERAKFLGVGGPPGVAMPKFTEASV